jgi:hypothetical protein
VKRKFKFIAKSQNDEVTFEEIDEFRNNPEHTNPNEYKRKIKKLRLSPDFVLALCGGKWPKDKYGACFGAVACWKIDTDRRALVPLDGSEGPDNECPVPDLELKMVAKEFQ